mmetsp:Transcript_821/g.1913  ORF Transcript_821/g.1913 Transcript_821/m.1913 type:complete len:319 (-) Transcript_821:573-1529(-)
MQQRQQRRRWWRWRCLHGNGLPVRRAFAGLGPEPVLRRGVPPSAHHLLLDWRRVVALRMGRVHALPLPGTRRRPPRARAGLAPRRLLGRPHRQCHRQCQEAQDCLWGVRHRRPAARRKRVGQLRALLELLQEAGFRSGHLLLPVRAWCEPHAHGDPRVPFPWLPGSRRNQCRRARCGEPRALPPRRRRQRGAFGVELLRVPRVACLGHGGAVALRGGRGGPDRPALLLDRGDGEGVVAGLGQVGQGLGGHVHRHDKLRAGGGHGARVAAHRMVQGQVLQEKRKGAGSCPHRALVPRGSDRNAWDSLRRGGIFVVVHHI